MHAERLAAAMQEHALNMSEEWGAYRFRML
jgi:hypothetical protein